MCARCSPPIPGQCVHATPGQFQGAPHTPACLPVTTPSGPHPALCKLKSGSVGEAPLRFSGCCPESSVSRTALGAQRRESGAPPERDSLPIAGPAPKCPVHPSSWSRNCASPTSSANLGPNQRPSLTSQPHFPPAGCCLPALELCGETAWEHLQETGTSSLLLPPWDYPPTPEPALCALRFLDCVWGLAAHWPFLCLC